MNLFERIVLLSNFDPSHLTMATANGVGVPAEVEDSWGWEPVPEQADDSEIAGSSPEIQVQSNVPIHVGLYGGKNGTLIRRFLDKEANSRQV